MSGGPSAEPQPMSILMHTDTANVWALSFIEAMERGANIYLCVPGERKQVGSQSGLISLKVARVLRGAPRESLTIPYTIQEVGLQGLVSFIWPSLKSLDGKLLLCVVVPNALDPTAGNFKESTEAASSVVVVKSADDPAVQEMAAVGEIADCTKVNELTKLLERGRNDARTEVRRFALKWGVFALSTSPEISLKMLDEHVKNAKSKADIEDTMELTQFVGSFFYRTRPTAESSKYVYKCLATLAQSGSDEVKVEALSMLSGYITVMNDAGRKSNLSDSLSKEERDGLSALVRAEKSKHNGIVHVKLDLIESALVQRD